MNPPNQAVACVSCPGVRNPCPSLHEPQLAHTGRSDGMLLSRLGGTSVISHVMTDFDQWLDTVTTAFVPLSSDPIGRGADFAGTLVANDLGKLRVARVRATPHVVWRSTRNLNDNSASEVKISFIISGSATIEQSDTQVSLREGGGALYHCDARYRLTMDQPFDQVVVQLDRGELEELIAVPSGQPIWFEPQNLFMRCLRSLATELTASHTEPTIVTSSVDELKGRRSLDCETVLLGDKMLDFLALAISGTTDAPTAGGPTRRELYVRALIFIRQHLGDPSLSPASVASAIGVSRRSLYQLFAAEGQTVAEFIIEARLDLAHRQLRDGRASERSITQVALACGFKSPAHFSRRFTDRFGQAPREVRNQTDPSDS